MATFLSSLFNFTKEGKTISETNCNESLGNTEVENLVDGQEYFEKKILECKCDIVEQCSKYLQIALGLKKLLEDKNIKPIRDAINFGVQNESGLADLIRIKDGYFFDFFVSNYWANPVIISTEQDKVIETWIEYINFRESTICQYFEVKNDPLALWALYILLYYSRNIGRFSEEFFLCEDDFKGCEDNIQNYYSLNALPHLYYQDNTLFINGCFKNEVDGAHFSRCYWQVSILDENNVSFSLLHKSDLGTIRVLSKQTVYHPILLLSMNFLVHHHRSNLVHSL